MLRKLVGGDGSHRDLSAEQRVVDCRRHATHAGNARHIGVKMILYRLRVEIINGADGKGSHA
jgi:hypothetical protein